MSILFKVKKISFVRLFIRIFTILMSVVDFSNKLRSILQIGVNSINAKVKAIY